MRLLHRERGWSCFPLFLPCSGRGRLAVVPVLCWAVTLAPSSAAAGGGGEGLGQPHAHSLVPVEHLVPLCDV